MCSLKEAVSWYRRKIVVDLIYSKTILRCLVMKSAKFHISSPTKNSSLNLSNTGKYCWMVSTCLFGAQRDPVKIPSRKLTQPIKFTKASSKFERSHLVIFSKHERRILKEGSKLQALVWIILRQKKKARGFTKHLSLSYEIHNSLHSGFIRETQLQNQVTGMSRIKQSNFQSSAESDARFLWCALPRSQVGIKN